LIAHRSRWRRAKRLRSCPPDARALRAPASFPLTSLRRSARHHLDDPRAKARQIRQACQIRHPRLRTGIHDVLDSQSWPGMTGKRPGMTSLGMSHWSCQGLRTTMPAWAKSRTLRVTN
jgi:hypothetical protein